MDAGRGVHRVLSEGWLKAGAGGRVLQVGPRPQADPLCVWSRAGLPAVPRARRWGRESAAGWDGHRFVCVCVCVVGGGEWLDLSRHVSFLLLCRKLRFQCFA